MAGWVLSMFCLALLCVPVSSLEGTIILSTYRRLRFAFDIFCAELPSNFTDFGESISETRLTHGDGQIINYNGFFASPSDQDLSFKDFLQIHDTLSYGTPSGDSVLEGKILAYVSERQGVSRIFFNLYTSSVEKVGYDVMVAKEHGSTPVKQVHGVKRRKVEMSALHIIGTHTHDHAGKFFDDNDDNDDRSIFFQDRPSIAQGCVIYASSQERPPGFRQGWTAVYSTNLTTGFTTRLTPAGITDYSPSVSPSGEWVLVASYGNRSWQGEMHELKTDLYIFNARDGSGRNLLVSGAGWPSWADDSTFFFHRRAEDGWWSIYSATISPYIFLPGDMRVEDLVTIERITPVGIHCFTPAASSSLKWVAVATRRPDSAFRQIEIYDMQSNSFFQVTNYTAPTTHHYNPFVSKDSTLVGYHKCRGQLNENERHLSRFEDIPGVALRKIESSKDSRTGREENGQSLTVPHLDFLMSPFPRLSLLRTDGEFPSFSPDGAFIAYIRKAGETGVRVMRSDGSGSTEVYSNSSFGTAWDRTREGVIYTSSGPIFHSRATVHIVAIFNVHKLVNGDDVPFVSKILTNEGTRNNAFPSPSPDGKFLVFRSSRSGRKNLYIMDAVRGEEGGLWRLTRGKWTDTMCSWSPNGEWIVFSSDRDNPGSGSFSLFLIHPNGTGLHRIVNDSQVGGRINHASFSPDSKSLLFTTDYAGLSAEPIAMPFQYQPYGDIFVLSLDRKHFERLTHCPYENGTPAWGVRYISLSELTNEGEEVQCSFDDVDWLTDGYNAQPQISYSSSTQALCGKIG